MPISEKDIQLHIWELRDNWVNLIQPVKFPEPNHFIDEEYDIWSLNPQDAFLNIIYSRLSDLDKYTRKTELIGCEVHLKKDSDSTIRADLLCCSIGRGGFGIIEIKKSSQTERQAYTELLGYGNHIQGLFPGMSTEDLVYILISPMEERIVREATLLSLLNDEKPVYCLVPKWVNDDITTLKLHPWIPSNEDLVKISNGMFHPSNIDIFKLTWDYVDDWNYLPPQQNPDPHMVDTLNKLSIYAAQVMESKHITGFVYASQPWAEMPLLPNSLIIAGINPFKVSKLLHLIRTKRLDIYKTEDLDTSGIKLNNILPEIDNTHNKSSEDYLEAFSTGWTDTIASISFETFKTMTVNSENETFETDHGSMTWEQYQRILMEDVFVHNYDVRPTGLLRKLFQAYQDIDYKYLTKYGYENHPFHGHGDIPRYGIDNWYDIRYFREFLNRLFDPVYNYRFDINDAETDRKSENPD